MHFRNVASAQGSITPSHGMCNDTVLLRGQMAMEQSVHSMQNQVRGMH